MMTNYESQTDGEHGFVALISILIVTVVALGVAVSISLLGVGEARNALDLKIGFEALNMADACGEEALLRIRNDDTYAGGTVNFVNGSCTIVATDTASGKEVVVGAVVDGPPVFTKSLIITIEQDGNGVTVVSWQEGV